MGLRRYTVLTVVLLVALGIWIYMQDSTDYTTQINGESWTLPIALWAMFPAIVVFAVSFSHIAFYAATDFISRYRLNRDIKLFKRLVANALLGRKSDATLNNALLSAPAKVLAASTLLPPDELEKTGDGDLDAILEASIRVAKGEAVDLSAIKPNHTSRLWNANQLNRMKIDRTVSEEILKDTPASNDLYHKALETYATYGEKKRFQKFDTPINAAAALNLLSRYKAPTNPLDFDKSEFVEIAKRADFNAKDYLTLARSLHTQIAPENLLELFFQIKSTDERALTAWLYLNIEFERLDEVRELFDSSAQDEFVAFRYYFALKSAGLSPDLDTLINCGL
ncbi:hypothetical protein AGMMS50229_05660 [Campylobacterota bacterium]|nr:hypothetical protein AGMMS50229_05660 [Campylobacterota bacterium]